jgi:hypothetical protein
MKKDFQNSIKQRTNEELDRITKDYHFYSAEERLLAINELKKRNGLSDDLLINKKHTTYSKKNDKGIALHLLFVALFVICLVVIGMGFQGRKLELRDTVRREGTVETVGTIRLRNQSTRVPDRMVFSIQFSDMRERFNVSRRNENYADLIENIQVGDSLIVYFRHNNSQSENRNVGVVQIEKNGKIILDISEFKDRQTARIYMGFFGLLALLVVAIFYYRDRKK